MLGEMAAAALAPILIYILLGLFFTAGLYFRADPPNIKIMLHCILGWPQVMWWLIKKENGE